MKRNKKKSYFNWDVKGLLLGLSLLFFCLWFIWHSLYFGYRVNELEARARHTLEIPDSWEVTSDLNADLCSLFFYSEDRTGAAAAHYGPLEFPSSGFYYLSGDVVELAPEEVTAYVSSSLEYMTVVSLNAAHVVQLCAGDTVKDVDPSQPFAVLLPACDDIDTELTILDENGQKLSFRLRVM